MLFEKFRSARHATHSPQVESPPTAATNSLQATPSQAYRDLVRMVLRDILRQQGIPLDWVGCEVSVRNPDSVAPLFQVNFVVHVWHEGLLRYAPLLQQKVQQSLQHFAPQQNHAHHVMAWVISPQVNCPHENIPGPAYWRVSASAGTYRPPQGVSLATSSSDQDLVPTAPGALR